MSNTEPKKEINMCDGCQRGLPLDEYGNHKSPVKYDLIGCTKERHQVEKKYNFECKGKNGKYDPNAGSYFKQRDGICTQCGRDYAECVKTRTPSHPQKQAEEIRLCPKCNTMKRFTGEACARCDKAEEWAKKIVEAWHEYLKEMRALVRGKDDISKAIDYWIQCQGVPPKFILSLLESAKEAGYAEGKKDWKRIGEGRENDAIEHGKKVGRAEERSRCIALAEKQAVHPDDCSNIRVVPLNSFITKIKEEDGK